MLERYKAILLKIIHDKLPDCKVYLYGSRARGDYQPESDIDLAIDNGKPIGFKVLASLLGEFEETNIPLKVDLIDLNDLDENFKKQVQKEMVLWTN